VRSEAPLRARHMRTEVSSAPDERPRAAAVRTRGLAGAFLPFAGASRALAKWAGQLAGASVGFAVARSFSAEVASNGCRAPVWHTLGVRSAHLGALFSTEGAPHASQ